MNKFLKSISCMAVIVVMVCTSFNNVNAEILVENVCVGDSEKNIIHEYDYPVSTDDAEWLKLDSVENKISACRISTDVLENMSNEALVKAIIEFPFIYDLFVYSDYSYAVEEFENICDAYAELVTRSEGKNTIINILSNQVSISSTDVSSNEEMIIDALSLLVLYQDKFTNNMSYDEIVCISNMTNLVEFVDENDVNRSSSAYTIRTPKGTLVEYQSFICSHTSSNYHANIDQGLVNTYGVTLIRNGSCEYNCHSYAWYNQNANSCWINNPSVYMTDGSYSLIMSGINLSSVSVQLSDKIFYGTTNDLDSAHSGIISTGVSGVPLAGRRANSKWGICGLFNHAVANVPSGYNTDTVTVWR